MTPSPSHPRPRTLWNASVADYRIACSVSAHAGSPTVVVVENGRELERHEPGTPLSEQGLRELSETLSERYAPHVLTMAKRHWRLRGIGCLATYGLRFPAPDTSDDD